MSHTSVEEYRQGRNVTLVGSATNIVLIFVKIAGGMAFRSQALIADGIHSVSDLLSDVVVLFGLKLGRGEEDEEHPFGHGRIETLAALLVGLLLAGAGIWMAVSAALDMRAGNVPQPRALGIFVAIVSVLSKEILYHYTRIVGRRINSPALMTNAWHHRSDALSSVAVLFGLAGAQIDPAWAILDPLAAIIVSTLILKVGASFVVSAFKEFIDTAPDKTVLSHIHKCACEISGVQDVHDIRARTSGGNVFVEVHITVDGKMTVREGHDVAKAVERCLIDEVPHLRKALVHVDPSE